MITNVLHTFWSTNNDDDDSNARSSRSIAVLEVYVFSVLFSHSLWLAAALSLYFFLCLDDVLFSLFFFVRSGAVMD